MTTSLQLSQLLNPTGREKTPEQALNSNHINRKKENWLPDTISNVLSNEQRLQNTKKLYIYLLDADRETNILYW